jgi:hypothetical protein
MVVVFFAKEIYQAAKNTLTVLSRVALLVWWFCWCGGWVGGWTPTHRHWAGCWRFDVDAVMCWCVGGCVDDCVDVLCCLLVCWRVGNCVGVLVCWWQMCWHQHIN